MIPVYQTRFVLRDGTGDCFNACVASIMEIAVEDVGDILPGVGKNLWYRQWQRWFRDRGCELDITSPLCPPSGYTIVSVETDRVFPRDHEKAGQKISHACVALDGVIVHDPFPGYEGDYTMMYFYTLNRLGGKSDKGG